MTNAAQPWENVYVFISSTFNDMHAERDYLVKRVFPELAEWCEERRLRLVDIDLRWGVTEKDSQENKRVVDVCLRNIDRCRPLFLCFLGQRRGWVPERSDISEGTFEGFPKLVDHLGSSVTEMEVIHALIDPMLNGNVMELTNRERAFFFLRDAGYLNDIENQTIRNVYTNEGELDPAFANARLAEFKERIRATGRPVMDYAATWDPAAMTPELLAPGKPEGIERGRLTDFECDGCELSEVVICQLKEAIAEIYPGREPSSAGTSLQCELDEQARFQQLACEGFIERSGVFDDVYAYLASDIAQPCAICAQAGLGKTSFIARLIEKLHGEGNCEVVYRFVGTSEQSVSVASLLVSIGEELSARFGLENVPTEVQKLRESLPDVLAQAAKKAGKRFVVLIDAVNQLDSGLDDLAWIPAFLTSDVRFIYSFKLGEPAGDALHDELIAQGEATILQLKGFENQSDRESLVEQYLQLYLKELDDDKIEAIISSEGARNPLFLKVLLSELRVFGSHEGLRDQIANHFGTTPQQAFDSMLSRLESDPLYSRIPAQTLVMNMFGWLSHAKNGLEPRELAELLVENGYTTNVGEAIDAVSLVLRQLRAYLAKRDKRQDFFYESFLLAVRKRYAGKAPWHRELATYFAKRTVDDPRRLHELAYQYAHAGMTVELRALLTSYAFMEARLRVTGVQGLIGDYALANLPHAGLSDDDRAQLTLVREALEMASSVLTRDTTQLPVQLFARLLGFDAPLIAGVLDDANRFMKERKIPWLKPLCACLPQPGGRILRHYKTSKSCDAQLFSDRKRMLVCLDGEQTVKVVEISTGRVARTYPFDFTPKDLLLIEEDNVFVVCSDASAYIVNLTTGESRKASEVKRTGFASSLTIKGAGNGMLVSRSDSHVYVTRIATGELLHEFESHDLDFSWEGYNGFSVAFDHETGYMLLTIEERGITAFDPEDGFKPVRCYCRSNEPLKGYGADRMKSGPKLCWTYAPIGTPYIVSLTKYDGVTVYDKHSGDALFNEMEWRINDVKTAISVERGLFARASGNRLSLYALGSFERAIPTFKMRDDGPYVSSLSFSQDGTRLFTGWNDGLVEMRDTSSWEVIDSCSGVGSPISDVWQDVQGAGLVTRYNDNQVVVWKRENVPEAPGNAADCLQDHRVVIAPDDSFILAKVQGEIQRIEIPSMERRVLRDNAKDWRGPHISCDSRFFMLERIYSDHVIEFFDCSDGSPVGKMELIDTTGTGHAGALKYWEPRFLPEELCLGSRNLTVLYRQWGNLAMQDLDAPEKTKVIHAFPGSILAMRLFDGDTKVALNSSNKRFDPEAGRDNNFETRDPSLLKDETKVYDLRTGECIEYYEDWSKWYEVSLRAQDLGDYPVAEAHAREDFHQNQRFFELCRVQGRLLYFSRGEGASDLRHVVVRDADLQEPLCWYTGDDRAPTWINAHCTSDGKYLFIRENTFLPFSLENVFDEELSSVDSSEGADESDHLHTDLAERFCNEQVQPAVDYPIDEQYDNNDNNDNSLYGAIAQLIDIYHQGGNG